MNQNEWGKWVEKQSPVPPRGDAWAKAAIVGEAPGEAERLFQKPFVGESGRLLSRLLKEAGIDEQELWIDNVCPFQPPKNDDEEIPPEVMAEYAKELDERLGALPKLNLIVLLGGTALFWVTGKAGITKWRGSLGFCEIGKGQSPRQVKYLASFHPSFVLRAPANTGKVLSDFKKMRREMERADIVEPPPKRVFLIQPKAKEVADFLEECKQAPMVSIDIEGNPKERDLICVGFSPSPKLAMCIPWQRQGDIEKMREFLASEQPKVGHFAAIFDNFWLSWFGAPVRNLYLDTMYMHHCLDPAEDHSLAVLASLFTEEPYWKDEAIDPKEGTSSRIFRPSEAGFLYNCKDAAVTYEIAEVLMEELKRKKKWQFYLKHYAELFPALLRMMLGGIRADKEALEKRFKELNANLKEIEEKLEGIAGKSLLAKKALSRQKEAEFLYETLELPKKWTKGKNTTGAKSLSTSEDTIRRLMEKHPKQLGEAGPLLLAHARQQKLSTFFNPARMQEEEDVVAEGNGERKKSMRLYFTLKPSTGTGRLASSKSPFKSGSNAQNIDRESRGIYLSETGQFLMEIDGSQVESRMCYMLTEDRELVRLANLKPWEYDAHKENAARIFEKDIKEVTKDERYTAKISVHAAQRAGTGKTLQRTFLKEQGIFKSEKLCQNYIDSYFRALPAVRDYFRGVQSQLFRERKLINRWGRELTFPWDRFSEEMFREAYSFPMQSDCADWMNTQGVIPLHRFLREKGMRSRLLLTVHDSLLISLEPSEAWDVLEFIIPSLEFPVQYPAGPLSIPAEISLGNNWGDKVFEWKKTPERGELERALARLAEIKET